MNKILLSCLFLSLLIIMLGLMTFLTLEKNKQTLNEISPPTESVRNTYQQNKPTRLSTTEVKKVSTTLNTQIKDLEQLNAALIIAAAITAIIMVWTLLNMRWQTEPFDGLSLIILTTLLYSVHGLFPWFGNRFEEANNATINLRIITYFGFVIAQPVLYYMAYRWNQHEVKQNIHRQRWISVAAILLALLSGLAALVLGIALLMTPDLSGNIT